MRDDPTESLSRERRIDEAIAAYEAAVDSGQGPDPEQWLAAHGDLEPDLRAYLDDKGSLGPKIAPPGTTAAGGGAAPPSWPGDGTGRLGKYELLGLIGGGGQSLVYRARQERSSWCVALKVIRCGSLATADEIRRLRVEADAVARLDHPNIVTVHEVGEAGGTWYLSMRLMEGGSLAERLRRYADDPRQAARLMVPIARAVHHAHLRGILHRDLKPSNILFNAAGQPHVSDFGLAKRLDAGGDQTITGEIVGTLQYMSPEQAGGHRATITTATDVYGLGAILYTMLVGKPPFLGETPLDILEQVKGRDPEPPSSVNRLVDRDLQTICLHCLEKRPDDRFSTAEALAAELERWIDGRAIQIRPVGAWERAVKWVRRRPALAGLLATTLLSATLGLAGVIWRWREERALRRELQSTLKTMIITDYYNNIALAEDEWTRGNFGRAAELIDGCPEGLRGWEWAYLMRLRRGGATDPRMAGRGRPRARDQPGRPAPGRGRIPGDRADLGPGRPVGEAVRRALALGRRPRARVRAPRQRPARHGQPG